MTDTPYPRDMVGYGRNRPHPHWPGDARIAVQSRHQLRGGCREQRASRRCRLGDAAHRVRLRRTPASANGRCRSNPCTSSAAESEFWRLHRLFTGRNVPVTIFGVAMALARNPDAVAAMTEADWEIASHGYRWIDYHAVPEAEERAPYREGHRDPARAHRHAPRSATSSAAGAPTRYGWWRRRGASSTARIPTPTSCLLGGGGRPAPADDPLHGGPQRPPLRHRAGFDWGEPFFAYLRDAFDVLYEEGAERPGMMSIGLHSRLVGRPGRFAALRRFVDTVLAHDRVWLCRAATSLATGGGPRRRALARHSLRTMVRCTARAALAIVAPCSARTNRTRQAMRARTHLRARDLAGTRDAGLRDFWDGRRLYCGIPLIPLDPANPGRN